MGSGNEGVFRGLGRLVWGPRGAGNYGRGELDKWDVSSPVEKVLSSECGEKSWKSLARWERASLTPGPSPNGRGEVEVCRHSEIRAKNNVMSGQRALARLGFGLPGALVPG